jgi:spermidine/putrescine transport system permease protein
MSSIAVEQRAGRRPAAAALAFVRRHLLTVYSVLFFAYLLLPIAVVVLFSFNHPIGKFNYTWQGFTWDNWHYWDGVPGIRSAIILSLEIALVASLVATALGTLIALALVRYGFRGRATTNILIFLPLSTPEIVLGASLLTLFLNVAWVPFGFWTILIAHIMFCLSFVIVTVRSRLAGLSDTLEQAAADLYATPQQAFWKVTFPLVFPGILGAALLAFSLSFDDFIITNLNAGQTTTFPMFVWGSAQRGVPMQVNVIGTIMFFLAVVLVLMGEVFSRRSKRATA